MNIYKLYGEHKNQKTWFFRNQRKEKASKRAQLRGKAERQADADRECVYKKPKLNEGINIMDRNSL